MPQQRLPTPHDEHCVFWQLLPGPVYPRARHVSGGGGGGDGGGFGARPGGKGGGGGTSAANTEMRTHTSDLAPLVEPPVQAALQPTTAEAELALSIWAR